MIAQVPIPMELRDGNMCFPPLAFWGNRGRFVEAAGSLRVGDELADQPHGSEFRRHVSGDNPIDPPARIGVELYPPAVKGRRNRRVQCVKHHKRG